MIVAGVPCHRVLTSVPGWARRGSGELSRRVGADVTPGERSRFRCRQSHHGGRRWSTQLANVFSAGLV